MTQPEIIAELAGMPVNVTALCLTPEEAGAVARADIVLAHDPRDGTIRNISFDATRMRYDERYENSQAHSPTFREHLASLARRLGGHPEVRRGIVEIGAGKGEFLAMLAAATGAEATGFDPSFPPGTPTPPGVRMIPSSFDADALGSPPGLLCMRHVLEHIDDAEGFLRHLADGVVDDGTVLYVEVPNAERILTGPDTWDVIYQHVWYFTAPALVGLLARSGFTATRVGTAFGGSFLCVEARRTPVGSRPPAPDGAALAEVRAAAVAFRDRLEDHRRGWAEALRDARSRDRRVLLWGAGAKGVTFLNAVPGAADAVPAVVDVNPRKQGTFVPGTAQPIIGPAEVPGARPDTVVVVNPVYLAEVTTTLRDLGVDARTVTLDADPGMLSR